VLPYNDAVAFCAAAPTRRVCNGDSGAALVTSDATHMIVGIASAGATGCTPGSHALYTNVEAPEILEFIRGNDHPPRGAAREPLDLCPISKPTVRSRPE
jgi:hypothetical protein